MDAIDSTPRGVDCAGHIVGVLRSDVTCDGRADPVVVGYEADHTVWLGVAPAVDGAMATMPVTIKFTLRDKDATGFCATPVRVDIAPIACTDEEFGELPGCRRVDGCMAFSVVDDACDAIHFY